MITEQERTIIKKVLGMHYTNSVYEFLIKEKVFSSKNKPYSKRMIQAVYQGTRENPQIENAIIELCHRESVKQQNAEQQRRKLIQQQSIK